jgi:hypothetical protein
MRGEAAGWTRATAAAGLAALIRGAAAERRESSVLGYALWVEAVRRPALRELAQRWVDAYLDCHADVLRELGATGDVATGAQLLSAVGDGLVAQQLAVGEPLGLAELTAVYERLLRVCLGD